MRTGKNLEATDKGIHLIEVVHPGSEEPGDDRPVGSAPQAYRARRSASCAVPRRHRRIRARGGGESESHGHAATSRVSIVPEQTRLAAAHPSNEPLDALLHRAFGFSSFRANQEEVCRTVIEGRDVAARDADGRGQIALLPITRHRARRHDAGDQPADCADGRSIRQAARNSASRWNAFIRDGTGRLRARSASTTSTASCSFCLSRPSGCASPAFPKCWRSANRLSSPLMKRTASRNGATISVPIIGCSAVICRRCGPRPSSPSPRPRRRWFRETSATNWASTSPASFIHGFRRDRISPSK